MPLLLEITAFVSGAVVMILELDGSRIIAPYLGTSTIIWTGLIGVILGSLSVGYWWGGKLADRGASFAVLGKVLAIAATAVLTIVYLKNVLALAPYAPRSIIMLTIIGAAFLFAPATVALGVATPYIIRLKMKTLETSGATLGLLYAVSTAGSIIGTFLGGFFLISFFGSITILLFLSSTLFLLSAGSFWRAGKPVQKKIALLCALAAVVTLLLKPPPSFIGNIAADIDTEYSRLWIPNAADGATGRPARYLANNVYGIQSGMFLDNPDELLFSYTKLFDLAGTLEPGFKKALMIGAGAYSYPKHFVSIFPNAKLDVVEIDPKLQDIAKKYFDFKENSRVSIISEDGRTFLNRNTGLYQVIWNDAFLSHLNIPFQLTTEEAVRKMSDELDSKGIVMTNILSAAEGPVSGFLAAEYATYKKVFPAVYLMRVENKPKTDLQNIMLVAFKAADGNLPLSTLKSKFGISKENIFIPPPSPDGIVLTDDFAPVEKYMAKMLPW